MKRTITVLLALMLSLLFAACQANPNPPTEADLRDQTGFVYSNLLGEASQAEMQAALQQAGVQQATIENALALVRDYNAHMTVLKESDTEFMQQSDLFAFKEGFVPSQTPFVDYGDYYFQMKKWYNGREYADIFCRTFAYGLLRDFIHIAHPLESSAWGIAPEESAFGDYEAITTHPLVAFTEQMQAQYFTLFHPVAVAENTQDDYLATCIADAWQQQGTTFDAGGASLVTIWSLVEADGRKDLYNSHAGVLLETADSLLFIEKTNPLAPYQISRFQTKVQLKQYMLDTLVAYHERYELELPKMVVLQNSNPL